MTRQARFQKRTYRSLGDFLRDFSFPIRHRKQLRDVRKKGLISPAFQERLMMAVTAVNGCRYCSYFHAREALKTGIGSDEIRELLSGDMDSCPADEAVAVAYAQHWAESNASPDPEAVQRLQQRYGVEKAHAIHLMLRLIRMGNLMGNTWDFFLHRISFGKWGGMASAT
jgi:AhpD family alkylhydroperoxidase